MKKIFSRILLELLLLLLPMAAVWFGFYFGFDQLRDFSSPAFDFSAEQLAYHARGFFLAYLVSRVLWLKKRTWWSILSYGAVLLGIFIVEALCVAASLST